MRKKPIFTPDFFNQKAQPQNKQKQEEKITELGKQIRKTFPYILKDDQIYQNSARFVTILHPLFKVVVYEWFNVNTSMNILKDFCRLFFIFENNFCFVDRQGALDGNAPVLFDGEATLKDVVSNAKSVFQNNPKFTNASSNSQIVLKIYLYDD